MYCVKLITNLNYIRNKILGYTRNCFPTLLPRVESNIKRELKYWCSGYLDKACIFVATLRCRLLLKSSWIKNVWYDVLFLIFLIRPIIQSVTLYWLQKYIENEYYTLYSELWISFWYGLALVWNRKHMRMEEGNIFWNSNSFTLRSTQIEKPKRKLWDR